MTYCLAIRVDDGLVALADSRISSGNQVTQAEKATLLGPQNHQVLVMTSGLRSVRDKTLAYFERALSGRADPHHHMLDAVNDYAQCLRRVAEEDSAALEKAELAFNMHTLVAGQLPDDRLPTVYLVYPEGNWVEITERTPYLSIGATAYGKPILDRALDHTTPMATALKLAYLSFDSTRTSSMDVGFPIDVLTWPVARRTWSRAHYEYEDLQDQRLWWNENITRIAHEMPDGPWLADLIPGDGGGRLSVVGEDG